MSNFHPPNAGNEIVHRDLKPANIFLDAPHTAVGGNVFYPNYPKARVGDFGQAFITNANDPFNPDWWTGFCATRGWTPPDLERYVDPNTLQPAAANTLNERTNVWQAGAILRAMILLEPDPVQSLFLNQANDNTYLVVGHPAAAGYTPNLLTCIDIMMRYDIGQRPTWYALNGLIQNPIPGIITPDDVAMRNGTAVGAQLAANTLHFPGDQFTIGFPPT
jgi:serine/threonine protein kinase